MESTEAHRQVTRRDARKEGEPDPEPSGVQMSEAERAMKDAQRDLTSLSGPVPRAEDRKDEGRRTMDDG